MVVNTFLYAVTDNIEVEPSSTIGIQFSSGKEVFTKLKKTN